MNLIDWSAPSEPGVYLFKSISGEIIYVGKAKSLRERLAHYRAGGLDSKTSELIKHADFLELIACRNEADALVLENTLIKQHRPKYNVSLKDSSYYAYLKITGEEFPRILTTRKREQSRGEKLLGPFVSGFSRQIALRETRRAFGIRICQKLPKQACLQFHLGFCTAPCIGKISRAEYAENVGKAESVLSGKTEEVEKTLENEMKQASERLDYERALQLRERISAISRIRQKQLMEFRSDGDEDFFGFVKEGSKVRCCVLNSRLGVVLNRDAFAVEAIGESPLAEIILRYYDSRSLPKRVFAIVEGEGEFAALSKILSLQSCELVSPQKGDKLSLVRLAEKNAALSLGVVGSSQEAIALQKSLGLYRPPASIDCFDVSNLAGRQNVGSCVRLVDGKPDKKNYRRFKVRGVEGQDDFASMKEIVYRRYLGVLKAGGEGESAKDSLPDLVLIDGGPGQLHSAMAALGELGIDLPIAALAKKEEEIYLPDLLAPRKLSRGNSGLKLLQRCRDEAHRFALKYNRKRREMESGY